MIVGLILNLKIESINKIWTYNVPYKLRSSIELGKRVEVLFNNRIIVGFIVQINDKKDENNYNSIVSVLDKYSYITKRDLNIVRFLVNNNFSKVIEYLNLFIHNFLNKNTKTVYIPEDINKISISEQEKYRKLGYLKEAPLNSNYTKKIIISDKKVIKNRYIKRICSDEQFFDFFNNVKGTQLPNLKEWIIDYDEIKITTKIITKNNLNKLLNNNIISLREKEIFFDIDVSNSKEDKLKNELLSSQKSIFEKISINSHKEYLLQGVTGSGKTHIFIELIKKVNKEGKIAYLLIPEVGLSYSIYEKINLYIEKTYIYHYKISNSYKRKLYKELKNNNINCLVGTRSSLFLNNKNIGIIIFDEEHDEDYYQGTNPRYNAKDLAKLISKNDDFPLVFSSATPSIETLLKENIEILKLDNKFNKNIIEKKIIYNNINKSFISKELEKLIWDNINKNEQSIFLFNKKAFAQYLQCNKCGFVDKCSICEQTRKVYLSKNKLKCNFCDSRSNIWDACPNCENKSFSYKGMGIEKVYEEFQKKFKNIEIVLIDAEVFKKDTQRKNIMEDINTNKTKIIIGTQIISKGFDFKNITLGGILDADNSINFPSYRAREMTFQLFDQFLGRVGRHKDGKIIIQTIDPSNDLWKQIINSKYDEFVKNEIKFRNEYNMPPFINLANIQIRNSDINKCFEEIIELHKYINKKVRTNEIYSPLRSKISNEFVLQFNLVYSKYDDKKVKNILLNLKKEYYKYNIHIFINNPRMG